jgi:hypothetical protein
MEWFPMGTVKFSMGISLVINICLLSTCHNLFSSQDKTSALHCASVRYDD